MSQVIELSDDEDDTTSSMSYGLRAPQSASTLLDDDDDIVLVAETAVASQGAKFDYLRSFYPHRYPLPDEDLLSLDLMPKRPAVEIPAKATTKPPVRSSSAAGAASNRGYVSVFMNFSSQAMADSDDDSDDGASSASQAHQANSQVSQSASQVDSQYTSEEASESEVEYERPLSKREQKKLATKKRKEREAEEKRKKKLTRKRQRGIFSLEEIVTYLDESLVDMDKGSIIRRSLCSEFKLDGQVQVRRNEVANSVVWSRRVPRAFARYHEEHYLKHHAFFEIDDESESDHVEIYPRHLLVAIPPGDALDLVQKHYLQSFVEALMHRYPDFYIYLLLEDFHRHLDNLYLYSYRHTLAARGSKAAAAVAPPPRQMTVPEVEDTLVGIMTKYKIHMYFTKNPMESASYITKLTEQIAKEAYESKKTAIDFNIKASKKAKVAKFWSNVHEMGDYDMESAMDDHMQDEIDALGAEGDDEDEDEQDEDSQSQGSQGQPKKKKKPVVKETPAQRSVRLTNTWFQSLIEIPYVSERVARGIVHKYPTLDSLMTSYNDPWLPDDEKRNLLKDLSTYDNNVEATKKIGQITSSKLFEFFSGNAFTHYESSQTSGST